MAPTAGYSQTTKPPADVKVTNSPAEPVPTRDVDHSAKQPFTVGLVSFNNNTFQVPAGKRLVIEYVSGRGVLVQGLTYVQVALEFGAAIDGNVVGIAHRFVPVRLGTKNGLDHFAFSERTRIYCEPGSVQLLVESSGFGSTNMTVTISGYLVDM